MWVNKSSEPYRPLTIMARNTLSGRGFRDFSQTRRFFPIEFTNP